MEQQQEKEDLLQTVRELTRQRDRMQTTVQKLRVELTRGQQKAPPTAAQTPLMGRCWFLCPMQMTQSVPTGAAR